MNKEFNETDTIETIKNGVERVQKELLRQMDSRLSYVYGDRDRLSRLNNIKKRKNKLVMEYGQVLDSIEIVCETSKSYINNALKPIYVIIEKGVITPDDTTYFNNELRQIEAYIKLSCRKINTYMRRINEIKHEFHT